jgi:glycosyltransferase involved in cell wall biosynthesis
VGKNVYAFSIRHPTSRARFHILHISETSIVISLLGYLKQYKGVEKFLAAALELQSEYSFVVAGECDDAGYEATLQHLASGFSSATQRLIFRSEFLSDQNFSDYLYASTYVCIPFVSISNSGSIEAALTAGKPVLVPNLPSLDWVPNKASVKFAQNIDSLGLAKTLLGLPRVDSAQYINMSEEALEWSQSVGWSSVAMSYDKVYRELISNKSSGVFGYR